MTGATPALAAALLALAAASEAPPVLPEHEGATRLETSPRDLHAEADPDAAAPPWPDDRHVLGGHLRYTAVPDALLDLLWRVHPAYRGVAAGGSWSLGLSERSRFVVELDWTRFTFPDANWREPGDAATETLWRRVRLHLLSADVSWRQLVPMGPRRRWAFVVGGGLGLGALVGRVRTREVLPTCEEPASRCPHWREATADTAAPDSRVLPVVHAVVGLRARLGPRLVARLEGGFRDAFYGGLSLGWVAGDVPAEAPPP